MSKYLDTWIIDPLLLTQYVKDYYVALYNVVGGDFYDNICYHAIKLNKSLVVNNTLYEKLMCDIIKLDPKCKFRKRS